LPPYERQFGLNVAKALNQEKFEVQVINAQILSTLITFLSKHTPKSFLELNNENALVGYCVRTYFPNTLLDCVTPYSIDFAQIYNNIYVGDILEYSLKTKYDVIFHHNWEYDRDQGTKVLDKLRVKARHSVIIMSYLEWYGRGVSLWTPEDFKLKGANIHLCYSESRDRSFLAVFPT